MTGNPVDTRVQMRAYDHTPLRIELLSGTTVLGTIAENVSAPPGSFTWTVGRLADGTFRTGPNLKIRISTTDGAMADADL